MRLWASALLFYFTVNSCLAFPSQPTLEELKNRLQNARPEERVGLALEIAEKQVANADKLFSAGKTDEAQAAVKDVVSYARQAGEAAGQTGHRIKNTEISLRKMAHRLADIKRSVAYDDQPPIQSAIDSLEKIRTDLLNKMFGKNAK
jgi:Domain of unknown function (DUF5667)